MAQVLSMDKFGLITHTILRTLFEVVMSNVGVRNAAVRPLFVVHVTVQVLQLAWLLGWPSSYCKHHTWINLASRARHVIAFMVLYSTEPTGGSRTQIAFLQSNHHGDWWALTSTLTVSAFWQNLGAQNHPLSVRPFLLVLLAFLCLHLIQGAHVIMAVTGMLEVREHMHTTCKALQSCLALPWSLLSFGETEPLHCTPGHEAFVMHFVAL